MPAQHASRPRSKAKKARLPEPRDLSMPPRVYQPSKAEMEEEIDMPGMSDLQLQDTFFRPFRFVKEAK